MKRALVLVSFAPLLLAAGEPDDPAEETMHVVKSGETIGGVAQRAVVPRVLIIEANGLKAPYTLKAGQKLVIPRRRSHTVKVGETGFEIALEFGVTWSSIATANGLDPKAPVKAGTKLVIPTISKLPDAAVASVAGTTPARAADQPHFNWPAPGMLLRGFTPGGARVHRGIDIGGELGSAVRAVASGKVLFAGEDPKLGNLVVIDHGQGWATAYAKLQKVTVKKGARAKAGERVGMLGDTGETPRTELHFEVRRYNLPVDPEKVLPERD